MGNWKTRAMVTRYAKVSDATLRSAAGMLAALVGGGHTVVTIEEAKAARASSAAGFE